MRRFQKLSEEKNSQRSDVPDLPPLNIEYKTPERNQTQNCVCAGAAAAVSCVVSMVLAFGYDPVCCSLGSVGPVSVPDTICFSTSPALV